MAAKTIKGNHSIWTDFHKSLHTDSDTERVFKMIQLHQVFLLCSYVILNYTENSTICWLLQMLMLFQALLCDDVMWFLILY